MPYNLGWTKYVLKNLIFIAVQGCPVQECEMVLRAKCNREEQHGEITRISRNRI